MKPFIWIMGTIIGVILIASVSLNIILMNEASKSDNQMLVKDFKSSDFSGPIYREKYDFMNPECKNDSQCPKGQACLSYNCVDESFANSFVNCTTTPYCDKTGCTYGDARCTNIKCDHCYEDEQKCLSSSDPHTDMKCVDCLFDNDCEKGYTCEFNRCMPVENGAIKINNTQTFNGSTIIFREKYDLLHPQCREDSNCKEGEFCYNFNCVKKSIIDTMPECINVTTCDNRSCATYFGQCPNLTCSNCYTGEKMCVYFSEPLLNARCVDCIMDNDCDKGYDCEFSRCVPKENTTS